MGSIGPKQNQRGYTQDSENGFSLQKTSKIKNCVEKNFQDFSNFQKKFSVTRTVPKNSKRPMLAKLFVSANNSRVLV